MSSIGNNPVSAGHIDTYFRKTTRRLIQMNTLDEMLQYLMNAFKEQFSCDFIAVLLKKGDSIHLETYIGGSPAIEGLKPFPASSLPKYLSVGAFRYPFHREKVNAVYLPIHRFIKQYFNESVSWFTIPITDETDEVQGLCLVSFKEEPAFAPELDQTLTELGKDLASAITLVQSRETEDKKIESYNWIRDHLALDLDFSHRISMIVQRAAEGTKAATASVYLYDERSRSFILQTPFYGTPKPQDVIVYNARADLTNIFSYWEIAGGNELTIPLIYNSNTIGVLHVGIKETGVFTDSDLEHLNYWAHHVSVLIENAKMFRTEFENNQRLNQLMNYHRDLVRHTVDGEGFEGISNTLCSILKRNIVLLDRFFHPISHIDPKMEEGVLKDAFIAAISNELRKQQAQFKHFKSAVWIPWEGEKNGLSVWPVVGGGDFLGYLAIPLNKYDLDQFMKLTIEQAINAYAIQFIKRKLVIKAKEQMENDFIYLLLNEKIEVEEREKVIQYSNFFNWDPSRAHDVGIISLLKIAPDDEDLLSLEAKRSWLMEHIKKQLSLQAPSIFTTRRNGELIIFIPADQAQGPADKFYKGIFSTISAIQTENPQFNVYMAIGGQAKTIGDYYICFKQASQTLGVLIHRNEKGGFAVFSDLGSYTVLQQISNSEATALFVHKQLGPLLDYSEEKRKDFIRTLQTYLRHNGSIKETADALFIHRSTLLYRLERIKEIIRADIDDSQQRFNLMLAFQLYELHS